MKLSTAARCLLIVGLMICASANAKVSFVEGSYIVTFKQDAGIVVPANEASRGKAKVPFGEHSTGQSKQVLAAALGRFDS